MNSKLSVGRLALLTKTKEHQFCSTNENDLLTLRIIQYKPSHEALPGVLGIQGEGLFIFRDLGRRVIYFQGFGEILGF